MDFSTITNFLSNNVLIVLIAGFFIFKVLFQASGSIAIEEDADSKVITVTSDAVWNEATDAAYKADKIVLVDFYATWCGPCRTAAPIYSKMSTEFSDVTFLKVDVDKMRSIMQAHSVRAMPTFVVLKNGRQVDRVEGFREASIRAMIAKHRAPSAAAAGAKKGE